MALCLCGHQRAARLWLGWTLSTRSAMITLTLQSSRLPLKLSTSYSLFKKTIVLMAQHELATPVCVLLATCSRLRNLVRDQVDQAEMEFLHSLKSKYRDACLGYEPERQHRILPCDFETETIFNDWVKQTFCSLVERRKMQRTEKDKDLLHLFRLLSLKFRAEHPNKGPKYTLRQDLLIALEWKICSSLTACFDSLMPQAKSKQKRKRSASLYNLVVN